MCDESVTKKRAPSTNRAIDELIWNHEGTRRKFVTQAANCADRDQALDAEHLHRTDIRGVRKLGRGVAMARAMPADERDASTINRPDPNRI
jgi:hypothetical protein